MRRLFIPLFAISTLPACDILQGGPSSSDLTAVFANVRAGPVQRISCAKVNDSTFNCRYRFLQPRSPADTGDQTGCFYTDGSKWSMRVFGC